MSEDTRDEFDKLTDGLDAVDKLRIKVAKLELQREAWQAAAAEWQRVAAEEAKHVTALQLSLEILQARYWRLKARK